MRTAGSGIRKKTIGFVWLNEAFEVGVGLILFIEDVGGLIE